MIYGTALSTITLTKGNKETNKETENINECETTLVYEHEIRHSLLYQHSSRLKNEKYRTNTDQYFQTLPQTKASDYAMH